MSKYTKRILRRILLFFVRLFNLGIPLKAVLLLCIILVGAAIGITYSKTIKSVGGKEQRRIYSGVTPPDKNVTGGVTKMSPPLTKMSPPLLSINLIIKLIITIKPHRGVCVSGSLSSLSVFGGATHAARTRPEPGENGISSNQTSNSCGS